jgi:Uracil phosphoribosyltransferase
MRLPSNSLLKSQGAQDIRFVCLLAAPEGIARFQSECPDVPIWTAAIDERLNDHGYIVPGWAMPETECSAPGKCVRRCFRTEAAIKAKLTAPNGKRSPILNRN